MDAAFAVIEPPEKSDAPIARMQVALSAFLNVLVIICPSAFAIFLSPMLNK